MFIDSVMQQKNISLRKKILTWLMPLMLLLILVDSTLLHSLAVNALEKSWTRICIVQLQLLPIT